MTKQEAIRALQAGYKLTHRFFLSGEYIFLRNDQIRDEANSIHDNFWHHRQSENWDKDWSIATNAKPAKN